MSEPRAHSSLLTRVCPACGSEENVQVMTKSSFRLVRCSRCRMIFADPVQSGYATGDYYDRVAASYYLSPEKLQSDYADVRFVRELQLFRTHCASGKILDVGCSSGAFLFQLQQKYPRHYEVLGTDASGPALDYAEKKGVPVRRGDFLQQSFPSPFDAVTFWAVLEHVLEPDAFLSKAAAVLRNHGLCFVLVPNMDSLAVRLLGPKYRYIYPQHLNYFTAKTLQELASRHFEVLELRFTHFNPIVIWQDWRAKDREISNEERGKLLERTTQYKQSRSSLMKLAKAAYGLTEVLLSKMHLADNIAVVLRKRSVR